MVAVDVDELKRLVEPDRVHRRIYADPDIFALEMERIFKIAWLYIAHTSQLAAPGDFVRTQLGPHDVIVTRDDDGAIHVIANRCAHRGTRLCTVKRGNAKSFTCGYHAWSYGLDGTLLGVPHRKSYPKDFDLNDPANCLKRAPRVDTYRGFVFASLAPDGPSLAEHLGPMTEALDNFVERAPDSELIQEGGDFTVEYPGNWKLHMENANDTVHPGFVHVSSVASARKQVAQNAALDDNQTKYMLEANGFTQREWDRVGLVGFASGHSYMEGFYNEGVLAPQRSDPVTSAYREAMIAAKGKAATDAILAVDRFNNLIYPNISVNAQYQQIRVVHPIAVDRTQITACCFRLKGAPESVFHRTVRFLSTINSPASMIFSDDIEIFARCQSGLSEAGGEGWVNVARGYGLDATDGANSWVSEGASELPVRAQFSAWLRHMTANGAR